MSFAAGAFSTGVRQDCHGGAQRRQFSVLNKNALVAASAAAAAAATTPGVNAPAAPGADGRLVYAKQQSVVGGQLVDIQVAVDSAHPHPTG